METRFAVRFSFLASSIVLWACTGGSADHSAPPSQPPASQGAGAASASTPDSDAALVDSTLADDSLLDQAAASQIAAMLPRHQLLVQHTLSRMQAEMLAANVTPDAAWNATADSVRQDLTRMTTMTPAALVQAMPAHTVRVTRLVEMQHALMHPAHS